MLHDKYGWYWYVGFFRGDDTERFPCEKSSPRWYNLLPSYYLWGRNRHTPLQHCGRCGLKSPDEKDKKGVVFPDISGPFTGYVTSKKHSEHVLDISGLFSVMYQFWGDIPRYYRMFRDKRTSPSGLICLDVTGSKRTKKGLCNRILQGLYRIFQAAPPKSNAQYYAAAGSDLTTLLSVNMSYTKALYTTLWVTTTI